jgi:hypothetical protein
LFVENHGNLLVVFESMDDASVSKLRDAIAAQK